MTPSLTAEIAAAVFLRDAVAAQKSGTPEWDDAQYDLFDFAVAHVDLIQRLAERIKELEKALKVPPIGGDSSRSPYWPKGMKP